MIFPVDILELFNEFAEIKGTGMCFDEKEVSLNAPDPGEESEQFAMDLLDVLECLLKSNGFKPTVFYRGGNIDAIRISSG